MSTPAPVGIDVNVLLSTVLGGVFAVTGSLAVAALYIRNQNKTQRKRLMRELVREKYFETGLLPIFSSLSEYGTSAIFALDDARKYVMRFTQHRSQKILIENLGEISNRPTIIDLRAHNFVNVTKYLPTVHTFGNPVFTSIVRTLQAYSSLTNDATSGESLQRDIEVSSPQEVGRSLGAIAQILNQTLVYLEKRFINLRDYFWQQELQDYTDLSKVFLDKNYQSFLAQMDEYLNGLTKMMDAMTSDNSESRKNTTLSFSKWLNDNLEMNPFIQKSEKTPAKNSIPSSKELP